ncbi:MAG: LytTR family transcriptional regulator DNA-binding domain-containing protein, partial [Leadbetterella sp.]|nr:LytTR family transcriptional regulator DNA-binding domain-containing protein [Leadbetterella sp.]
QWLPGAFVFLTANSDAVTYNEASLTHPAAYLLKPYRHKELAYQIDLAYRNFMANRADNADPLTSDSLFLPYGKGYQRINKKEIIFVKADGSYVNIRVNGHDVPYKFTMNIGYLAQFFDPVTFFQLSRSYMINLSFLERFDTSYIYLKGHHEKIPIPQNRKQEFLKRVAVVKNTVIMDN